MQRKSNRLEKENYYNHNVYYLTLACFSRSSYFVDKNLIDFCLSELKSLTIISSAKLWAYCFMPDHVHLLLETQNCLKFVKLFKQKTGFHYKKNKKINLWQKSYYDHIIRKEEQLSSIIEYIFNNPVRAQMVTDYLDYPYSGSFEFDKADFMES